MSRRGRARGEGRQKHEVTARIVEIREAGTCTTCHDPECAMVEIEARGGEQDGKRFWVGACMLQPHVSGPKPILRPWKQEPPGA